MACQKCQQKAAKRGAKKQPTSAKGITVRATNGKVLRLIK